MDGKDRQESGSLGQVSSAACIPPLRSLFSVRVSNGSVPPLATSVRGRAATLELVQDRYRGGGGPGEKGGVGAWRFGADGFLLFRPAVFARHIAPLDDPDLHLRPRAAPSLHCLAIDRRQACQADGDHLRGVFRRLGDPLPPQLAEPMIDSPLGQPDLLSDGLAGVAFRRKPDYLRQQRFLSPSRAGVQVVRARGPAKWRLRVPVLRFSATECMVDLSLRSLDAMIILQDRNYPYIRIHVNRRKGEFLPRAAIGAQQCP